MPDVDASVAAYPRQKFRIMQSKHLLITFIISTATVAQSRNLTPDPHATPSHPGSSPCLLLFPNPGRECWGCLLACWLLACSAGEVACLMYLPHTHHMWLAVNKQPTPTHAHTYTHTRVGRREVIAISTLATRICAKKCATRVFIYLMPTTDRRPPFNTTRAPQIAIMDSTYTQNGNKKEKRQRLYMICMRNWLLSDSLKCWLINVGTMWRRFLL